MGSKNIDNLNQNFYLSMILGLMGIPASVGTFPKAYKTSQTAGTAIGQAFYSKLITLYTRHGITEDIICRIYDKYRMDFEL